MDKHFVTVVQHEKDNLGIVYINTRGRAIFAVSASQNGLADAILENYWGYDHELTEICLQEISELEISELSREYHYLSGSWAAAAGDLILGILKNGGFPNESFECKDLEQPACSYWDDEESIFFVVFSKEPKIMQLFSKQQGKMVLESFFDLGFNPKDHEKMEKRIAESQLPEEIDFPPSIWEDSMARFMINSILAARSQIQKKTAVVIPHNRPWKQNFQYN